jgi:hypothetical protein
VLGLLTFYVLSIKFVLARLAYYVLSIPFCVRTADILCLKYKVLC